MSTNLKTNCLLNGKTWQFNIVFVAFQMCFCKYLSSRGPRLRYNIDTSKSWGSIMISHIQEFYSRAYSMRKYLRKYTCINLVAIELPIKIYKLQFQVELCSKSHIGQLHHSRLKKKVTKNKKRLDLPWFIVVVILYLPSGHAWGQPKINDLF